MRHHEGRIGTDDRCGAGHRGAVCNWLYLQRLAREQETVSFIAIKPGVQLNIGDTFDESDLEKVDLPKARYGNLVSRAPQWSALIAVVDTPANRVFSGGEIILDLDLEAPASRDLSDTLQEDEVAYWVPITAGSVVADQINPGDLVSFQTATGNGPTPAGSQPRGRRTADHRSLSGAGSRRPS